MRCTGCTIFPYGDPTGNVLGAYRPPLLRATGGERICPLVSARVFEWNSCKQDMTALYMRLVELGMEYRNGKVYLADLEK